MSKFKVLTALFLPAVLFCTLASGADNKVRELKVYGKRAYKKPIKLGGLCWQLSGEFRTDGEPTEVVLGMELLDKDGNQIYPFVFTAFPAANAVAFAVLGLKPNASYTCAWTSTTSAERSTLNTVPTAVAGFPKPYLPP